MNYRQKSNFEGSPSGVYQLETNDGQQTLVRRVEVVDIPAVDPQCYITYGLRTTVGNVIIRCVKDKYVIK